MAHLVLINSKFVDGAFSTKTQNSLVQLTTVLKQLKRAFQNALHSLSACFYTFLDFRS